MGKFTLRNYQEDAIVASYRLIRSGVRKFILQACTGAGKTAVAAEIMTRGLKKGSRFLFLAHRLELLEQPYQKLFEEMEVPESQLSIIKSGEKKRFRPDAPIQIASIMSLDQQRLPPADVVFVDECHLSAAQTFKDVLAMYPKAVIIGLTATPQRMDNKCLGDIYEEIHIVAQPLELVKQGFIVKAEIYSVPEDQLPEIGGIKHASNGDFNQHDLGIAVNKRKLVGSIADHWLLRAPEKRTLCFAVTIEHGKRITEELVSRDHPRGGKVRALLVHAKSPKDERAKALLDLKNHEIDILVNVGLFVEGLDIPSVKCIVLARPTESLTVYLQAVGRGCRPWENEEFIILDHAGNVMRHGLPTLEREYSLDPEVKFRRTQTDPDPFKTKTCKQCFRVVDVSDIIDNMCPCGASFPIPNRSIETLDGTLVLVGDPDPDQQRKQFYAKLWQKAYSDGHDSGWVIGKYRDRFGELPESTWSPPPRPDIQYTPEQKLKELKGWQAAAARNNFPSGWVERKYKLKFNEEMPSVSHSALAVSVMQEHQTAEGATSAPETVFEGDL